MNISTKLISTLCLLGLVPVWILAWSVFSHQRDVLLDRALSHVDAVATVQRARIELLLKFYEDEANLVASRTQMRRSLAKAARHPDDPERLRVEKIVNDAIGSIRNVLAIGVLDREGRFVARVVREGSHPLLEQFAESDHGLKIAGQPKGPARVGVHLPLDLEGKPVGSVLVVFDEVNLVATTSDYTGLYQTGETLVAIRDARGDALFVTPARFDRDAAFNLVIDRGQSTAPIVHALAGHETTMSSETADYRGETVLAATRYLPEYGVGIVVKIDTAEARAPVAELAKLSAGIASILSLLVVIAGGRLAGHFTAPVLELQTATRVLREGSRIELPADERADEFGELFHAFNQMSSTLHSERERLAGIVSDAPVAMVIVDEYERIVMVNAQSETLFGYRDADLAGIEIERLLPGLPESPQANRIRMGRDLVARRRDASEFRAEVASRSVNIGGEPMTILSIVDLSVRKRIEDELRRSNTELERFASIASHDLQEPLRKIQVLSGLLVEDAADSLPSESKGLLRSVIGNVELMRHLVEDLLEYSRIGSMALLRDEVSLECAVDDALDELTPRIRAIDARIVRDPLPVVLGDRSQLAQLFRNLIENALEFAGPDGREISITAESKTQCLVFGVRDSGVGFDPAYSQRVLEPFKKLGRKDESSGTGMGLAICAKIVDRHRGRLWIETLPGRGVHARFTLGEFGEAT